jgi:hypothetical protein
MGELLEAYIYMQEKIGNGHIIGVESLPERVGTAFEYRNNLNSLVGKNLFCVKDGLNMGEVAAIESKTHLRLKCPFDKFIHVWALPHYDAR